MTMLRRWASATACLLAMGCGETSAGSEVTAVDGALEFDAVVELPLNEGSGTTASDASGNGNDGTLVNGASFEATTVDGFAVRLDGVDDFIDLGPLDIGGSAMTLAVWFRADSFPGRSRDPRLISKATGTSANDHVFMLSTIRTGSATRLRARVRVGGTTTTLIASDGDLDVGEWMHAAVTYDGVTLRLYLDGVEVGSRPLSGAIDVAPSVPVTVGSQPPGAGARFFDGLIDDVRILARALSEGELSAIANPSLGEAPVAMDDSYQTPEDTPLSVDALLGVISNDVDGESDPLQAILVDDVSHGVLILNDDGSFEYTPDADFDGEDQFTYRAQDWAFESNLATVRLTVVGTNDAPSAEDDAYEASLNLLVSAAGGVLSNDTDPEQDTLRAILVQDVTNGVLTLNDDGSFDYVPTPGFVGQDAFTYLANDSELDSNLATVTISVTDLSSVPRPERPWAGNTGVVDSDLLVPSEAITITTDGTVLENLDISGMVTIDADDVSIRNFRIEATSAYGIRIVSGHSGIVLEDGEIYGMSSAAIFGAGFTARRLYIHDSDGDGIKAQGSGGPTLVEQCFIEKLGRAEASHADGNQTRGGADVMFRYNNIFMPSPGTPNYPGDPYQSNATFMLQLSISNFVIESNWLTGGNYTIYCAAGVSARRNIFGRENAGWPDKAEQRIRAGVCDEWSGNVFE